MTSNPMLQAKRFENTVLEGEPMSISGAVNKTIILNTIVVIAAFVGWNIYASGMTDRANMLTLLSLIASAILAVVAIFNPKTSPVTAPFYAIFEGIVVGGVSYSYAALYNGIVPAALFATLTTLFVMLILYKTKLIQATQTFKKVVMTAGFALFIYYLVSLIGSFFGHSLIANTFGTPLGIGISVFACAIAGLYFILYFELVEQYTQKMLPKYMEWYSALGILFTTVWLYFEILRLIAQLNSRR